MTRKFAITIALTVLLGAAGCRMALVREIDDHPIARYDNKQLTSEQVMNAIARGGADLGWMIKPSGPGAMVGRLEMRGKHTVEVDIRYDAKKYSIHYRSSENLKYDSNSNAIHRSYNRWINNLIMKVDAEMQRI